ncbi:hypothetical protein CLOLEP_03366 [[Clostridium] leptum DSM 753]|uniref:Uncharacterized protein n=1 Tax=[Clostridium] leptum DSM 753 TaxID=428125 RepID=A7VXP1_9FIRM|nr:hypothetical protein CLOLEP_03366 [[Clostridium] leptum DSM 753]
MKQPETNLYRKGAVTIELTYGAFSRKMISLQRGDVA